MIKLTAEHNADPITMKESYAEALTRLGEVNAKVVTVEADCSNTIGTAMFANKYPLRSINVGIAEGNAVGVAAGLAATGLIPFFHTFAAFATRRVYDQAFISCAYAGLNVKIIGADPGVTAAHNGGTHMPFEDAGIMRNIPGAVVIEPTDAAMLRVILPQIANHDGLVYMRFSRKNSPGIYQENQEFTIGKGALLREGTDVTLIANGIIVAEALQAADMLAADGISARVIDMFTFKPIDSDLIIESAQRTGALVTAENHSVINGLGSAVSEVLTGNCPVPLERIGSQDEFGEVGTIDALLERFGLRAFNIAAAARRAIERKQQN